jgi:hypothetical protein
MGHSKSVPGLKIETGGTPSFSQLFEFCRTHPSMMRLWDEKSIPGLRIETGGTRSFRNSWACLAQWCLPPPPWEEPPPCDEPPPDIFGALGSLGALKLSWWPPPLKLRNPPDDWGRASAKPRGAE